MLRTTTDWPHKYENMYIVWIVPDIIRRKFIFNRFDYILFYNKIYFRNIYRLPFEWDLVRFYRTPPLILSSRNNRTPLPPNIFSDRFVTIHPSNLRFMVVFGILIYLTWIINIQPVFRSCDVDKMPKTIQHLDTVIMVNVFIRSNTFIRIISETLGRVLG